MRQTDMRYMVEVSNERYKTFADNFDTFIDECFKVEWSQHRQMISQTPRKSR